MAYVWRVETEQECVGLYRAKDADGRWAVLAADEACGSKVSLLSHPGPLNDDGLVDAWTCILETEGYHDWRFGFMSLDQYQDWCCLPEHRKALAEFRTGRGERLVLRRYEVPDDAFAGGDTQAVFRVTDAVPVEDLTPDYSDPLALAAAA